MASILKIGDKWRALIRRKGYVAQCKTFATKAKAELLARSVESKIDAGESPAAATGLTVEQLIDEYRRLREHLRPISDLSTEHYTLKQLKAGLGAKLVDKLQPADLVSCCQQRRDEDGAGPYTCLMDVSKLGTAMRYAGMSLGLALPDVVAAARPLLKRLGLTGGGGKRERRPTDDEIAAIREHMTERRGPRQGEITGLQWSGVDDAKRLVLVRDRKDPRKKAGNDQWVPLLGEAWTILQRQPKADGEGRIFPIGASRVSKYFTECCAALSIPDLHFEALRGGIRNRAGRHRHRA